LTATLVTIWGTEMLCLLIPTIPLTTALLPVVGFLSQTVSGSGSNVLFYGLSMGSALGANNSLVGQPTTRLPLASRIRPGIRSLTVPFLESDCRLQRSRLSWGLWILIRFWESFWEGESWKWGEVRS
jgi:hypothetical protein